LRENRYGKGGVLPLWPEFFLPALMLNGRFTGRKPDGDFYLAFTSRQEPTPFVVPPSPESKPWRRTIDASLVVLFDIVRLDGICCAEERSG
jgi:hypothetical protein